MELYLEDFDVNDTLNDVTSMAMSLIEKKNNALATDYGDKLGIMHSDLTKIRQNLFNLISNAVKFTEEGYVRIGVREIRDSLQSAVGSPQLPTAGWLLLTVEDTGSGIPADQLDRVFERFQQVEDNQAGKPKGTGLGLPICKEIIAHHGGEIGVESEEGEGSTFFFSLPCPPSR